MVKFGGGNDFRVSDMPRERHLLIIGLIRALRTKRAPPPKVIQYNCLPNGSISLVYDDGFVWRVKDTIKSSNQAFEFTEEDEAYWDHLENLYDNRAGLQALLKLPRKVPTSVKK